MGDQTVDDRAEQALLDKTNDDPDERQHAEGFGSGMAANDKQGQQGDQQLQRLGHRVPGRARGQLGQAHAVLATGNFGVFKRVE